jgi:hypothetical protein
MILSAAPGRGVCRRKKMKEIALVLWAMTVPHHQPTLPQAAPALLVQTAVETQAPQLDAGERLRLRQALDRIARCSTGKLAKHTDGGFYIPEQKANCR